MRYRHGGLPRKLTLQAGVTLSAARKLAADAMHEVAQGHDPAEAKVAANARAIRAKADTVEAICTEFMQREGRKLRTVKARESALKRLVYPAIGAEQIDKIKRSQIVRLLDKIEDQNGDRMADVVLGYLRRVFNWHARRSDDFRSPIVPGMGRYDNAANARSRVLSDDELRSIWKASETAGTFGALMRFLLLTGARRNKAGEMPWSEIDGIDWLLPAARNKVKVVLVRPLSKAALAVIDAQPRIDSGPLVFGTDGHRPISFGYLKRKFDAVCGVTGWRLHDLSRTARTLMSRAGVSADHAERCLGHVIGGVRGVYDRHEVPRRKADRLRDALIGDFERIVNPPEGDVVPMIRRKN